MSFHCPQCDGLTGVVETRAELRSRRCKSCGYKFVTEEVEYDGPMLWPKKTPEQNSDAYKKRKVIQEGCGL